MYYVYFQPVTMGGGPLEQPLSYKVYNNGTSMDVNSTTVLVFVPPQVPPGYFVSNIIVFVTAINRFGAGPPSEDVSVEISKLLLYCLYSIFGKHFAKHICTHVYFLFQWDLQ